MAFRDVLGQVQSMIFGKDDILQNRRREPRVLCDFTVLCKIGDDDNIEARLVDLGTRGMQLQVPARLKRGQEVRVSALPGEVVGGRQRLRCMVAWCKESAPGFYVGLKYADTPERLATSWVQLTLRRLNCHLGERKGRRISAGVPVEIHDAKGVLLTHGTILDLSLGGAMVSVERDLPWDQNIRLRLGEAKNSISLQARVVNKPGDSTQGVLHSLKFFPADSSDGKRLRSLLMTLLDGLRTPGSTSGAPVPPTRPAASKAPKTSGPGPVPPAPPPPLPTPIKLTVSGPVAAALLPLSLVEASYPARPREDSEPIEPPLEFEELEYDHLDSTLTEAAHRRVEERRQRAGYPSRFLRSPLERTVPNPMEGSAVHIDPPMAPPQSRPMEPPPSGSDNEREAWSEYGSLPQPRVRPAAHPPVVRPPVVPPPGAPSRFIRRPPPPQPKRHPLDDMEGARGWAAELSEEPIHWQSRPLEGPAEGFLSVVAGLSGLPVLGPALVPSSLRQVGSPPEMLSIVPVCQFPALTWAHRQLLTALTARVRRSLEWLPVTLVRRQRLERRLLGTEEVIHHFLATLALGGDANVHKLLETARLSAALCESLGIGDPAILQQVRWGAMLKDLGEVSYLIGSQPKAYRDRVAFYLNSLEAPPLGDPADLSDLRIPMDLYLRPRKLSAEDLDFLRIHPSLSQQLLANQVGLARLAGVVRAHHERWDGAGYPDGRRGEAIPVAARCLALADMYSALRGQGLSPENAAALIRSGSGSHFDPAVVKAFQRLTDTDSVLGPA